MPRSSEVIRQWEILRDVDGARNGISVGKLAAAREVCERTVRRDLEALARAGFPLYDDKTNGTALWKLRTKPFGRLEETGLDVMELCALYFSRALMDSLAGTPLLDDAARAFAKIERALPQGCRKFLDRLPRTLQAKSTGRKRQDDRKLREIMARVLDATLLHRRATMRYASASSRRTKEYVVEPHRIAYADGGIYLAAWVLEYGELRHFAAERIQTFALMDDVFQPRALPVDTFGNSLGAHSGAPEEVVIEFSVDVAAYICEREWHKSQVIEEREDGGVVLTLQVCNDRPLRAWILGFGPDARVVAPVSLARDIFDAVNATRRRYVRTVSAETPVAMLIRRA
jgi:predicted DNA-binding transcriptional regulator YafY